MNYFKKCTECVPPERRPGCQSYCRHYEESRAAYDRDKAKANKYREADLYSCGTMLANRDRTAKQIKANKGYRRFSGYC